MHLNMPEKAKWCTIMMGKQLLSCTICIFSTYEHPIKSSAKLTKLKANHMQWFTSVKSCMLSIWWQSYGMYTQFLFNWPFQKLLSRSYFTLGHHFPQKLVGWSIMEFLTQFRLYCTPFPKRETLGTTETAFYTLNAFHVAQPTVKAYLA